MAVTLAALMAPGAWVPKGSWRIRPVAGSSTLAPPSWMPSQILPSCASKIVMTPSALTLCGSPALTGMDSSLPVRQEFLQIRSPMVPIHSVSRRSKRKRHDALIAESVVMPHDVVDVGGLAVAVVELHQAAAHGGDPYLVIRRVGEGGDDLSPEPLGPMAAELPAARIPAADAAGARADPNEAGAILVQRHDEGVAQRCRIAVVMAIVREVSAVAIQQIETFRGSDPKVSRAILEDGAHIVARERAGPLGIVTESSR